jgi:para-nitrobenzyl esterase
VSVLSVACERPRAWSIAAPDPATRRTTTQGEVVGGQGRNGSHAWLGIPFAAPPVGDLRWRAPSPPQNWSGTRSALSYGSACPQYASPIGGDTTVPLGQPTGSEDCLTLNIWAPPFTPDQVPQIPARLPVLFWIHGGGNTIGTASFYDPSHLAVSQGVIVVTTQYRLGPFGFFRNKALRADELDTAAQSGNFGTLDLIRALQWVRDNIAAFGGDPEDVTIFGESAGGMNVLSLLVSPEARGLFHRAISESGGLSSTTPDDAENFVDDASPGRKQSSNEILLRLLQRDGTAKDRASARAKLASMSDGDVDAYLRGKTTNQILTAYTFNERSGLIDMPLVFHDGAVLPTQEWTERYADPKGWNRVPVILGTNHDEAKLFLAFDPVRVWRLLGIFPKYVNEASYEAASEYLSRAWKVRGADEPAAAMRKSGATDVYVYRFDWHGEPVIAGADLSHLIGAAHSLEIPFVFGRFDLGKAGEILFSRTDAAEREDLSAAMMSYWTQFARTGSPGRGRQGNLTAWTPWADGADAAKFLVLDTPSEGGIAMANAEEKADRVLADLEADVRLARPVEKCRVYRELAGFTRLIKPADFARVSSNVCAQFPYDDYPWPSSR